MTYQGTFLKHLLKETFKHNKTKSKYRKKAVLINLLTLFSYWSNQIEKLIAAVKSACSHD